MYAYWNKWICYKYNIYWIYEHIMYAWLVDICMYTNIIYAYMLHTSHIHPSKNAEINWLIAGKLTKYPLVFHKDIHHPMASNFAPSISSNLPIHPSSTSSHFTNLDFSLKVSRDPPISLPKKLPISGVGFTTRENSHLLQATQLDFHLFRRFQNALMRAKSTYSAQC